MKEDNRLMIKQEKIKPEGIRAWYFRTTSKSRKFLLWATVVGLAIGGCVFGLSPDGFVAKIQQFNGAITIPVAGFIWIVGFILLFLVPQREASFRGQEWIEQMVSGMLPVVEIWKNIGNKVEAELPGMLAQVKDSIQKANTTLDDLRVSAKKIDEAVLSGNQIAEDARPAIEALKRIEASLEAELKKGFFIKVDSALESIQTLGGLPKTEQQLPDMGWALESIRRNKEKTGAKS